MASYRCCLAFKEAFIETGDDTGLGLLNLLVQQHNGLILFLELQLLLLLAESAGPGRVPDLLAVCLELFDLLFLLPDLLLDGSDPGIDMVRIHLFRVDLLAQHIDLAFQIAL